MKYDFSSITDRRGTGSFKWAQVEAYPEADAVYPLSTADMEFPAPPEIRNACAEFAQRGFYCYTEGDGSYKKDICDFMLRRHNWKIQPEWIVNTYGIVSALHTAVKAFTDENDGVIAMPPVYAHFYDAARLTGRKLVKVPLVINGGRYEIDFAGLEEACKKPENKMLIFCSPHNPVGRVWTRDELLRTLKICRENGVIIVSDEIHFDITKNEHTVISNLGEGGDNCVICTAVSKSFNVAGLATSNIIIENDRLRRLFTKQIEADGYSCINAFAYPATHAAYTACDSWLDEMNERVNKNFEIFENALKSEMPKIFFCPREGTYMAWLDVSCFNIPDSADKADFFAKNTGFIPNDGAWFEGDGTSHIRVNLAVAEETLRRFITALKKCYDKYAG